VWQLRSFSSRREPSSTNPIGPRTTQFESGGLQVSNQVWRKPSSFVGRILQATALVPGLWPWPIHVSRAPLLFSSTLINLPCLPTSLRSFPPPPIHSSPPLNLGVVAIQSLLLDFLDLIPLFSGLLGFKRCFRRLPSLFSPPTPGPRRSTPGAQNSRSPDHRLTHSRSFTRSRLHEVDFSLAVFSLARISARPFSTRPIEPDAVSFTGFLASHHLSRLEALFSTRFLSGLVVGLTCVVLHRQLD
jgi:hypothetical protein